MGLLVVGKPLTWKESEPYRRKVLESGVEQLIHIYERVKNRTGDCLKWGDEIEMMLVTSDDESRRTRVSLRAGELLAELMRDELAGVTPLPHLWRPEYSRFSLESTPGRPYAGESMAYAVVELNMIARRRYVKKMLKPGESVITMASYPRIGAGEFTEPPYPPGGPVARSLFVPDEVINEHPRFPFLSANIRERRGEKVRIGIPVFKDTNTGPVDNGKTGDELRGGPDPCVRSPAGTDGGASVGLGSDMIYMDAMAFGMGMACLQVTFQGSSIDEARDAYDPLTAISPFFLALTAATPIFRGYLTDIDARWSTISASVDDRTADERDPASAAYIPKSRYDSVSRYISSSHPDLAEKYSDLGVPVNAGVMERLMAAGMDKNLATHFAGLYVRDPLVIFADRVDLDDTRQSDHFESIQSTNWQTVRFKPPPPESDIGWRVEFRPMEVQFSDFENAAFTVFTTLLTRVLLSFDVNLYMPLTLVDENMRRAHARDAAVNGKFWIRRHIIRRTTVPSGVCCRTGQDEPGTDANDTTNAKGSENGNGNGNEAGDEAGDEAEFVELSLDAIINGSEQFVGLVPLVETYLNSITIDLETRAIVDEYVALIAGRASGRFLTNAAWIRKFVREHPEYAGDSVVTEGINHDLVAAVRAIGDGEREEKQLGDLLAVRRIVESVERRSSHSDAYD